MDTIKKVEAYQIGDNAQDWNVTKDADDLADRMRRDVLKKYIPEPVYNGYVPDWYVNPYWDDFLPGKSAAWQKGFENGYKRAKKNDDSQHEFIRDFLKFYTDIKRELDRVDAEVAAAKAA